MRPIAAALLALLGWVSPRPGLAADATGGRVTLHVQREAGTEGCTEQTSLQQAVEARLERSVFSSDQRSPLAIELVLSRAKRNEWSAWLELRDSVSGRSLGNRKLVTQARHCSALDDSLALVVALLVDAPLEEQLRLERQTSSAQLPPAPAPPASASAAATQTLRIPEDVAAPRQPWSASARVAATAAVGIVPGVAPGVELGVGARPPRAPELRAFGGFAASGQSDGVRVSLLYAGIELCPVRARVASLEGSLCAGEVIGALRAEAYGFDENSSSTRLYFAPLLRFAALLPLSAVIAISIDVRAELPLVRPEFVAAASGGDRSLSQSSVVAGMLGLGMRVGQP